MNATETIQAAITKLETQRDATVQGPWGIEPAPQGLDLVGPNDPEIVLSVEVQWDTEIDALDLIVTLHRTIDAQLAILQNELRALHPAASAFPMSVHKAALDLARAILGEES